ncbi:MAG: S8 family serine peptidase, partial [Myxococcota bacterium]
HDYGYGLECTGEALENATCGTMDMVGHGSHCSGIMGSSTKKYQGMAPGGSYVVAQSTTFQHMIDAASYIFKRAATLGMPATMNMSLGGHYGPHDGTSGEEQGLAELGSAPGNIIVAAAGNEGGDTIHLGYETQTEAQKTLLEVRADEFVPYALLNSWYAGSALVEFAVGVADQDAVVLAETPFYAGGSGPVEMTLSYNSVNLGQVQMDSMLYPNNDKYTVDIVITPSRSSPDTRYGNPDGYVWYLKARGAGWFDSWMAAENPFGEGSRFSTITAPGVVPGDTSRTVGMPATSPGVIAVASYETKNTWKDMDGNTYKTVGTISDISGFSSIGPSGDGARTGFKPDIAAPGQVIASTLSQDAILIRQPEMQVDRYHQIMQGTSMACPHVNGVVALMLQADPKLTVARVRKILSMTASHDSFTGETPNYRWGYGKLRAEPAVKTALGIGMCEGKDDCKDGRVCEKGLCMQVAGGKCYSLDDCSGGVVCDQGICGGPAGGCSCSTVGVGLSDDGGQTKAAPPQKKAEGPREVQVRETSLKELDPDSKPAGKGGDEVDGAFRKLTKAGVKVTDITEVLGVVVGADRCIQAVSGETVFIVCRYPVDGGAQKNAAKRRAIFGESNTERTEGALLVSVQPVAGGKPAPGAARLLEIIFGKKDVK